MKIQQSNTENNFLAKFSGMFKGFGFGGEGSSGSSKKITKDEFGSSGIDIDPQEGESLRKAFLRSIKENKDHVFNAIISISIASWEQGDYAVIQAINNKIAPKTLEESIPNFKMIHTYVQEKMTHTKTSEPKEPDDLVYRDAAKEFVDNFEFLIGKEDETSRSIVDQIKFVMLSAIAFKFIEAIKKVSTANDPSLGKNFIKYTKLINDTMKMVALSDDSHVTYFSIAPEKIGNKLVNDPDKVLMMDWTREGWVRLPSNLWKPGR